MQISSVSLNILHPTINIQCQCERALYEARHVAGPGSATQLSGQSQRSIAF